MKIKFSHNYYKLWSQGSMTLDEALTILEEVDA